MKVDREPIIDFLLTTKGCQWENSFHGCISSPTIHHKHENITKKPYLAGVRYERSDTKTPSYEFHFFIIERSLEGYSDDPAGVIEKIETLRQFLKNAVIAADTVEYYALHQDIDAPTLLREWAIENGIGILSLDSGEDDNIIVRETLSAESVDLGIKRSEFVSNTSQRSPGNFRKAIEKTSILKSILEPREFFDDKIRPDLEG